MTRLASWRRDGSPWRAAQPIADLAATLRRHGYAVYIIGNESHLADATPEDHTPYSGTGWPHPNPYGFICALDIMPPSKPGLPSLSELGARIAADRNANVPGLGWLKYMNWTRSDSRCVQDSWQGSHRTRSSGDRGHIHISARSDCVGQRTTYDPVARCRDAAALTAGKTAAAAPQEEPDMDPSTHVPVPDNAPFPGYLGKRASLPAGELWHSIYYRVNATDKRIDDLAKQVAKLAEIVGKGNTGGKA